MRGLIGLLLFAVVAACDAPAPEPANQTSMKSPLSDAPSGGPILHVGGEGVTIIAKSISLLEFGTSQIDVESALLGALGEPVERTANGECGAGPMEFYHYIGGVTLNFQNDKLVGWFLRRDEDQMAISTPERIRVGATADQLDQVYDVTPVENSTLGAEFTTDEGISGFFSEAGAMRRVESLYAGTNCFFR